MWSDSQRWYSTFVAGWILGCAMMPSPVVFSISPCQPSSNIVWGRVSISWSESFICLWNRACVLRYLFFSCNFRIFFSSETISRPSISQTACSQLLRSPQEGIICGGIAPNQGWSSRHGFSETGLRTAVLSFCFPFEFLPHPPLDTWGGGGYSALVLCTAGCFLPFCLLSS